MNPTETLGRRGRRMPITPKASKKEQLNPIYITGWDRVDHLNFHQLQMFMPARELHTDEMIAPGEFEEYNFSDTGLEEPGELWDRNLHRGRDPHAGWLEEPGELWDRKLEESQGGPVGETTNRYRSIQETGIQRPVTLRARSVPGDPDLKAPWKKTPQITKLNIMDGYHRVASAYDINPDTEVPVTFGYR